MREFPGKKAPFYGDSQIPCSQVRTQGGNQSFMGEGSGKLSQAWEMHRNAPECTGMHQNPKRRTVCVRRWLRGQNYMGRGGVVTRNTSYPKRRTVCVRRWLRGQNYMGRGGVVTRNTAGGSPPVRTHARCQGRPKPSKPFKP